MKKIVLKSTSPRRKELLEKLGYDFIVKSFDVDETMNPNLSAIDNVLNVSLRKVLAKREEYKEYIQIGCDTIVVLDGKVYGKPKDEDDAKRMLQTFSGKTHQVISGLSVIDNDIIYNTAVISYVTFKKLTETEIDNYIKTKECFGKAGAYAIQGLGKNLVESYSGSLNNIIGLPTEKLKEILGELHEL